VVVNVTKAFYDLLATSQQIRVGEEDIIRLQRSLKDATAQYNAGVADKTDYKRATILLANAKATLKTNQEMLVYKQELLKTLMGYPVKGALEIAYDTLQMESEIDLDTTQTLSYASHIDYKLMITQRELQEANVKYAWWGFIPSLNAFGAYFLNYQNNNFGELYNQRYPNSYVGATFSFPIFQGMKRVAKVQEQRWTLRKLDWSVKNLESSLSTEYTRSLAAYKSNLAAYIALKENVELAREVYDVIQLQYKSGIRAYLDVTVAETDLRTARINYFNALVSNNRSGHGFHQVGLAKGRDKALERTQSYARLYMAPGVYHCSGGPGPNVFDVLTPLVTWVETGVAPETLVAAKFSTSTPPTVEMTRPLCVYPKVPRYNGSGNTNVAASFTCVTGEEPFNQTPAPKYGP